MAIRPKPTVFSSDPTDLDAFAAVDVYGGSIAPPPLTTTTVSNPTFNKITALLQMSEQERKNTLLGKLVRGKALTSSDYRAAAKNMFGVDLVKSVDEYKENVANAVLKSVGINANPVLVGGLLGLPGHPKPEKWLLDNNPNLKMVYDGVKTLKNVDVRTANDVLGIIETFTGNTALVKILDLESEASLLTASVGLVKVLKIPKLIDKLFDNVKPEVRQEVVVAATPKLLKDGDVETANYLIKELGFQTVKDTYPDVIKTTLQQFKIGNNYDEDVAMLTEFLDALPADWHKLPAGTYPDRPINQALFEQISFDAREVLSKHESYRLAVTLSKVPFAKLFVNRFMA